LRHAAGALPRILLIRVGGMFASLSVVGGMILLGWIKLPIELFLAVAATAVAESFLRIGGAWHRARHLAWTDFWTTTGRSLAVLVLVGIILPLHPDAMGIALAYGSGAILILVSLIWHWRRILSVGWKSSFLWANLFKAASSFSVLDIIGNATGLIPSLLLGHFNQFLELGRYSIYIKYLGPFSLIASLYVHALQPSIVRAFHKREAIAPLLRRGAKVIAISGLGGFCASMTVGAVMVALLGHQQPVDFGLITLISAINLFVSAGGFIDSVLTASRNEWLMLRSHTIGILVCGSMAIAMARLGAKGMAFAVAVAFFAKFLAGVWLLVSILKRAAKLKTNNLISE